MARTAADPRSAAGSRTIYNRNQNYSISLNGSTDYVFTVGTPVIYNVCKQVYSVEFWVKGAAGGGRMFAWNRSSGNAICAIAGGGTGNTHLSIFYRNDANSVILNNVASTANVLDNTWHHVVVSDNAGTMNVYIDKNLDATNFNYTVSGTFTSLNTTGIGCIYTTSAGNLFTGKLDQVRVYNIALNQTQVNAAFANNGYPASNLMYDIGFDEGTGTVINNKGGFGPQWKLVGGTFSTDVPTMLEPITRISV